MSTEHKDINGVNVDPAHFGAYANAAARVAATPTSAEVSKLALQSDTGEFFRLASIGPTVWASVVGTVVAAGAALGATSLQPNAACNVSALTVTQAVATSGSPTAVTVTGGAHTTLAASTEAPDLVLNLARTVQFATGNFAIGSPQRAIKVQAPTYNSVAASTIAVAALLSLSGAPIATGNVTITDSFALYVESGAIGLNHGQKIRGKNNAGTAFLDILDWGTGVANTIILGQNGTLNTIVSATSTVTLQCGGISLVTVTSGSISVAPAQISWSASVAAPNLIQANGTGASAQNMTVKAQGTNNTAGTAADLILSGGDATAASGTHQSGGIRVIPGAATAGGTPIVGNLHFVAACGNFQAMQGGIFLGNNSADPTGNPASGGFLYVASGALKYRGSGGTITTVGAA